MLQPPPPPIHTKKRKRRKEDTGTFHTNWRVNEARHEGQGFGGRNRMFLKVTAGSGEVAAAHSLDGIYGTEPSKRAAA